MHSWLVKHLISMQYIGSVALRLDYIQVCLCLVYIFSESVIFNLWG
jgi:hypothetical protein